MNSVILSAGVTIALAASLGSAVAQDTQGPRHGPERIRPQGPPGRQFRSIDEEFKHVASVVPGGFGGWFFDAQGRPNVYLLEPAQRGAAVTALIPFLRDRTITVGGRNRPDIANIQVLQGQYDFPSLLNWRQQIEASASEIPSITHVDIQERTNRVVVGVETDEGITHVRRVLDRLSIPSGAVIVERRPRQAPALTLQQRASSVAGGYLIQHSGAGCTLGFNGWRWSGSAWESLFITAMHCGRRGVDEDLRWYQISVTNSNDFIGTEHLDPPFVEMPGTSCGSAHKCRYADAMAGLWQASRWGYGRIARTTGVGSLTVDASRPEYRIIGEVPWVDYGEEVWALGSTTGFKKGNVNETCFSSYPEAGKQLLCQDGASLLAAGGDSGGPVFSPSGYEGWVYLRGLRWGSNGAMSSMINIEDDLGALDTFDCTADNPLYPNC
ncbi:hypothetical protein [Longimicrobium sp.]|jgi:hypothetical protein|uniref:hypothetical protein n=1 Tax=Longimicrobium sp. TaxID=2029185 RepID=UPI002ED7F89B